jgi:hypothetical protein
MEKTPEKEVAQNKIEAEASFCRHGSNPSVCEACFLENQPSWSTIERLKKESGFKRSNETSAECVIESEGNFSG